MAFLSRLASGIKEGLNSFSVNSEASLRKSDTQQSRSLNKTNSKGKRQSSSLPLGILEAYAKDAISAFVQEKFDRGEAKPHVFTQFWLQFPKLEAGFNVLRSQLEARTGSREGPLPLELLRSDPRHFGLAEGPGVVQELCNRAIAYKCGEIDFVGLVMLLLVVHLTEPPAACPTLHPDVRTMLCCLELAFTHFNSARKGKLDKREVGEALQYESAKAHTREGRSGRTSNRLAQRLFEGLDWDYDNTISFEDFLRGILQLVSDEFGEVPDAEEEEEAEAAAELGRRTGSCTSGRAGAAGGSGSPSFVSSRVGGVGGGRVSGTGEGGGESRPGSARRPLSAGPQGGGVVAPVASSGSLLPSSSPGQTGSGAPQGSKGTKGFLRKTDEGMRDKT